MSKRRFRVAFSFSAEKRDFVASVAKILAERFSPSAILYDKYHEAEFARLDLGVYLPNVYRKEADLVVVVISPDDDRKTWCGLELSAVRAALKERGDSPVMLCRFGAATIKGVDGISGFIELDHKSPAQTATLILERLALNERHPKDYYTARISATAGSDAPPTPNNLPQLPHFFGRDRELKIIADSLSLEARTWGVLVDGQGGIGKTSLAIRAAQLCPRGQFDRILFLSAKENEMTSEGQRRLGGGTLPGYLEILNEIARLLGQFEFAKSPENERAKLVLGALSKISVLLVLDNLETLRTEHRDQLYSFLSRLPMTCKAIVTSRRRTDIDARVIRLEKLERSAALDYLADLAKTHPLLKKASESERIRLYEETGGSPLFMRWIVGQLGRGKCRTVASALAFLSSASLDNDPLEFAFGDLLETFSENETKILAALTHFSFPVEVPHLAALAGIGVIAAQTALDNLAERALVVADPEQQNFALVPLVATFLRNKRPEVVAETGDRLEKRAYALIVENGYDRHDRFPGLEATWPSIAPALPFFLAGDNARLQTVCDALRTFLEFQGRWDEWLTLCEKAEARAVAAADHDKAGWRAHDTGWIHILRQQADAALTCADRAAAHWQRAHAGARERATAIGLLGIGHQLKKDYPAAITAYREAIELYRSLGTESEDVASGLNRLAVAEQLSGDLAAAEGHFREALRVARAVGYAEGVAYITGNLAELALDRKDWLVAETLAREALALSEAVHRQELIASTNQRIATALVRQDKAAAALPHAQRAVDIFTRLGSPRLEEARATLRECEG